MARRDTVDADDVEQRGEQPWPAVGPSAIPYAEGWPAPAEMSVQDIRDVVTAFRDGAARTLAAGFRVIEVYAAQVGVDAIACSTGGISGRERPQGMTLGHGYQLPLAGQVRRAADITTIGVGLLWDPRVVEQSIEQGDIDLAALARELLDDPNWPLHAARELGADPDHQMWHPEFGWWLEKRARALRRLRLR